MNSTQPTSKATEKHKLLWRARRGMLELDLLLIPFIRHCFDQLSAAELSQLQTLLHEEDTCLLGWLSGRAQPESVPLRELIKKITRYARQD